MSTLRTAVLVTCTVLSGLATPFATANASRSDGGTITLKSKATLTIPTGFAAQLEADDTLLRVREPDGRIAILVVEATGELAAAIQATADSHYPDSATKPRQSLNLPDPDWDEVRLESSGPDSQGRLTQYLGKRRGSSLWILVTQGEEGALEQRAAQINSMFGSLKVPAYTELDLSGAGVRSLSANSALLDEFVRAALARTKTPGLAIAVIEDGKLAYAKGYGQTAHNSAEAVDADTRFMIGSITKSMSTLFMARLVDAGKMQWSDRVASLRSDVKVHDPELSSCLTMQHLACACTGIPRVDLPLMINHRGKCAADALADLSHLKQTTKLGETFQYNNQLVAAAGFIAAGLAKPELDDLDAAYAQAMHELVFSPLAMERTTLDMTAVAHEGHFARPHARNYSGDVELIDLAHEHFASYVGPSGGVWSTAHDMAKYIEMELQGGLNQRGERLLSEANLLKRRAKQAQIDDKSFYGLGWMVKQLHGLHVVTHNGSTAGFAANVAFLPAKGLGFVVLSNSTSGLYLLAAIEQRLLELWFNAELGATRTLEAHAQISDDVHSELRRHGVRLEHEFMAPLLGEHTNPRLGAIRITRAGESYTAEIHGFTYKLLGKEDASGQKVLMLADLPLLSFVLVPVAEKGVSLMIARGQESYGFTKS